MTSSKRLAATTVDGFLRDPLGRFVRGPTYLVWCADSRLCGATYWGRPNESDAGVVVRLLAIEGHPAMIAPFDVLTDARHIRSVDPAAFGVLAHHLRAKRDDYAARIRRHALVHPDGPLGQPITSLYFIVDPAHVWRPFASVAAGLSWLGRQDAEYLSEDLEQLLIEANDTVERFRRLLAQQEVPPNLQTVAGRLGVSKRSLQRSLEQRGLTFRREVARARWEKVEDLISDPSTKLQTVARRAGYASDSGLRAALRRARAGEDTRRRAR